MDDNISFNDLSFLENNSLTQLEKMNLIKKYKDKAILNLYTLITKILDQRNDLELNIEMLTNFLFTK